MPIARLKAEDVKKAFRIWFTSKFQETNGDALTVQGLPTPNRM